MLSATQRTLRALRAQGRICAVVERWNPYAGPHGVRQDLFGWIDIIALDPEKGIVAIQSTTGNAFRKHLNKIKQDCAENVLEWLHCGGKAELWAWRKVKLKRGGKAEVWRPRIVEITEKMLVS